VAELTLAKAKLRADEMLDDLRQGIVPGLKADANMTLKAALDIWPAATICDRPASAHIAWSSPPSPFAGWPLRTITPDAVEKRHRELGTKTGGHTANATMRTLRVILESRQRTRARSSGKPGTPSQATMVQGRIPHTHGRQ
jgi:hypothetical protein